MPGFASLRGDFLTGQGTDGSAAVEPPQSEHVCLCARLTQGFAVVRPSGQWHEAASDLQGYPGLKSQARERRHEESSTGTGPRNACNAFVWMFLDGPSLSF
jgi:hypothetical protein